MTQLAALGPWIEGFAMSAHPTSSAIRTFRGVRSGKDFCEKFRIKGALPRKRFSTYTRKFP